MIAEGRTIMENLQRANTEMKKAHDQLAADLTASRKANLELREAMATLTADRDALRRTVAEDQELKEEMGEVIILEHTRDFKKALRQVSHILNVSTKGVEFDPRKDVYQGKLVSLRVIPTGTFSDDEPVETIVEAEATEVEAITAVSSERIEGNPTAP